MEFIKPNLVNGPGHSVRQHDSSANKFGLGLIEFGKDCARCRFNTWHDVARMGCGGLSVAQESVQLVANARQ